MYTLYYGKGAASLAIHAALKETGVPYELVEVDLDGGQQRSPEYLRLNPRGKVPTLVIDGKPFHESAALMLVLAERHPHANLAPCAARSSSATNRCGRRSTRAWPIMDPTCWAKHSPART